jgi:predicted DCC family thiol-disulfide oxidoreductase YuxK
MQALTYYVWCLEILGPILIFLPVLFLPFRLVTLFFLIIMHIGFFLCLEIGLFPAISITSLLTFLPGRIWDWLGERLDRGGSAPIQVFYDGKCDFCRKVCDLLRVFLILPGVVARPAQDDDRANQLMEANDSWVVVDAQGTVHLRWAALVWLCRRSPIFWPVGAAIERLGRVGDRIYGLIARNRWRFSGFTGRWLRYREVHYEPTLGSNLVVVFFLLLVLRANLNTVGVNIPIPDTIRAIYPTLRLYQNWSMFAPYPRTADTWLVPMATLKNGMVVDPRYETMKDPDFEKPPSARAFYPSYRWRKFTNLTLEDENAAYRPLYAQYLCRKWNSVNAKEFQIESMRILVVKEPTLPNYEPSERTRYLYWEGDCDAFQRMQRFDEAPEAL